MLDSKIVGGLVVDGTGAAPFRADVGIKDGLIVDVRRAGELPGAGGIETEAVETIDATGKHVLPGFVDIHTHYDGQVTWDTLLEPSSGHGVTTVVSGNCGVGFAPVTPGREEWLIKLMEGVEDIPGTALTEGMTWGWESFPGYLDRLADRGLAVDFGVQIGHGPLRAYVMGDRGARNEPATPDDIEAMARLVQEAVEAGALGFSTSRTLAHRAIGGEPVPGTFAAEDELFGLGRAMARGGRAVFELAPTGAAGEDILAPARELDWMRRLAQEIDRPVSYALLQVDAAPNLWRELMETSAAAFEAGAPLYPQVAARPFGLLIGFAGLHAFSHRPTFRSLSHLSPRERGFELARPAVRAAILAEQDLPVDRSLQFDGIKDLIAVALDRLYAIGDPPDYEPTRERTVAAIAEQRGVTGLEALYDLMLESAAGTDHPATSMLMIPFFNYSDANHDAIREMLSHPAGVSGLSDGGAHCGTICDASYPTFLLTHWARDRTRGERLPLELLVKKQSADTAALFGLGDRGVVEVGKRADLNVVDLDRLTLHTPRMAYDLPAGGRRLIQDASGYDLTMVAGTVTRRGGKDTGARPGRLLRGAR
ncbi:amidohydrolase family protein [Frankia sp. AgB1.9]|uniref:N-acyl-D-amino-acid deacylase family protein n=1 Tax=unclassified Frankia TaxID=2632575 RepID=UPI00193255D9|nr:MULTISPECIES: amidohydrolase family protein [unclassified Frankia]MBL7493751.1 amidohydrolase family protein [Frankia sp. AgW1.1]MBL7553046.1 amidohydrolase family protein [Frankia sp. AgB1.9]MBL7620524.1 amidohydrolase family protein [Frankia sp. AgB1.8]